MPQIYLQSELDTYEAHRSELVDRHGAGKFVVIQGGSVVGVWDTYDDALKSAYQEFGVDTPFMVKKIEAIEGIQFFSRDIAACRP